MALSVPMAGCHRSPTSPEGDQIREAISVIRGERPDLAECLQELLRAGRLYIDNLGPRGAGVTASDKETGCGGDVITIDETINLSGAQDFACAPQFVQLMATLVHEAVHAKQQEADLPTPLERKRQDMRLEEEAYQANRDFIGAFEKALKDIMDDRPVAPHWARFQKCTDAEQTAMLNKATAVLKEKDGYLCTYRNILANIDDLDAPAINQQLKAKGLASGFRVLLAPDSPDAFVFREGSAVVQRVPTGIPDPRGLALLAEGRVLLVSGVSPGAAGGFDGTLRRFVDADQDGILEFDRIGEPLQSGRWIPSASHPWFIGRDSIAVFGAIGHSVRVLRVDPSGKETLLGEGVVQGDNRATIQLAEVIRDRVTYRVRDLQQGVFTDGAPVPFRSFVTGFDPAIQPLAGGGAVRAEGFALDKVDRVFVGDASAPILSRSDVELVFLAPPQKGIGHKSSRFVGQDGAVHHGPNLLYVSDQLQKLILLESPSFGQSLDATGSVLLQARVGDTTGQPLPQERVVLQRLDTVLAAGDTDASGRIRFQVGLQQGSLNDFRLFADQPPFNGLPDDGEPETSILFPGLIVVTAPFAAGRAEVLDPPGDTFETFLSQGRVPPDVVRMTAEREAGAVRLAVEFLNPVVGTGNLFDPNVAVGFIDLDTDQDLNTGILPFTDVFRRTQPGSTGMGTDFFVSLFGTGDGNAELFDASTFLFLGNVPVAFEGNTLSLSIPLALLGNDDGDLDFSAVFGTFPEPTDVVPNDAHGTLALGRAIRTVADVQAVLPMVSSALAVALPPRQGVSVTSKLSAAVASIGRDDLLSASGQLGAALHEIDAIGGKTIQGELIDPLLLAPSRAQVAASRNVLISAAGGLAEALRLRQGPAENPVREWGFSP